MTLRGPSGTAVRVTIDAGDVVVDDSRLHVTATNHLVRVEEDGRSTIAWAVRSGATCWVYAGGAVFTFEVMQPGRGRPRQAHRSDSLAAPMPATVRHVAVAPGDTVGTGDVLVVLEAMKMELPVRAPAEGVVRAVNCREGEIVAAGHLLVELAP